MSLRDTRESVDHEQAYLYFDFFIDQAQDQHTCTEAEAIAAYKHVMALGTAAVEAAGAPEASQTGQ